MAFNLIPADREIKDKAILAVVQNPAAGFPAGGRSTAAGASASNQIITFQFPPIIRSDDKSARWDPLYNTFIYEPEYIFKGGDVRKLTLEATYVVGGPSDDGEWTTTRVANEIRRMKAYFYASGSEKFNTLPVFILTMYEWTSEFPMHCRGTNVSVKPGESMIRDSSGKIFSLRTDVTLSLEMVTRIETKDGKNRYNYSIPKIVPEWY